MLKVKFRGRIEIRNFYLFRVAPLFLIPSFASWWIVSAYLQIDVYNLLSYFPGEPPGNVQVGSRHLGVHTFGDYLLGHEWAMQKDPWASNISPPSQYPPLAVFLFRLLGCLPYWVGFTLFGLLALTSFLWIILREFSEDSVSKDERFRVVLVCSLSAGVISVFDRGNAVVWLVIPIFLWMRYTNSEKNHLAAFWLAVSISLKIYPIIIMGIQLVHRQFKQFLLTLFYVILISLLSLLFLVSDPLASLNHFIHNVIAYGNQGVGGTIGHTLNLAGAIGRIQLFIIKIVDPSAGVEQVKGIVTHPILIGLIYSLMVYITIFLRAFSKSLEMYYVASLLWMVTDLSYVYNTCVLVAAIAYDIHFSRLHDTKFLIQKSHRIRKFELYTFISIYFAVTATLAPIAIPIYKNLENGWHTLVTLSWLLAMSMGLLYSLTLKALNKETTRVDQL